MTNLFHTGAALLALCAEESIPVSEAMLRRELEIGDMTRAEIFEEMRRNLQTMRAAVEKGLHEEHESVSGLSGKDAQRLYEYACGSAGHSLSGALAAECCAASMAVVEVNAAMGRIVAAPTAGACGILPGVLLSVGKARAWGEDTLLKGLFNAAAIGALIAAGATLAGADGGCQAETGAAAAMAASALAELCGGSPKQCLDAASIALTNILGLVCDPVAGLVEYPCINRNALGASNALLCADLALAGVPALIPLDEAIAAMKSVGRLMSPDLRETALGGCAATPTGRRVKAELGLS